MQIKVNNSLKITLASLFGAILFAAIPFITHAYSPNVATSQATNVTSASASFNGAINTNNLPTTTWFEYDVNPSFKKPISINASRINAGTTSTANISGLNPETAYYFRAVAQNADGISYGNINSFTTTSVPPINYNLNYNNGTAGAQLPLSATTEPASSISSTGAQLNSLITNGGNDSTNAWFEWGATVSLGNKTKTISTGFFPSAKHANTMTGLNPGTTYYFRAVAENSSWKNTGAILSFTTPGSLQTVASINTNTNVTSTGSVVESGDESLKAELQSANASSSSFLPGNMLGWTTLIVVLFILILLSKRLYRQFLNQMPEHPQPHTPAH